MYAYCNYVRYRGEFTVGNETYSVEPVDETLSGRHRVYRESDIIHRRLRCGVYICLSLRVGTHYPYSRAVDTASKYRSPTRVTIWTPVFMDSVNRCMWTLPVLTDRVEKTFACNAFCHHGPWSRPLNTDSVCRPLARRWTILSARLYAIVVFAA